jgi:hypothetical protein
MMPINQPAEQQLGNLKGTAHKSISQLGRTERHRVWWLRRTQPERRADQMVLLATKIQPP